VSAQTKWVRISVVKLCEVRKRKAYVLVGKWIDNHNRFILKTFRNLLTKVWKSFCFICHSISPFFSSNLSPCSLAFTVGERNLIYYQIIPSVTLLNTMLIKCMYVLWDAVQHELQKVWSQLKTKMFPSSFFFLVTIFGRNKATGWRVKREAYHFRVHSTV